MIIRQLSFALGLIFNFYTLSCHRRQGPGAECGRFDLGSGVDLKLLTIPIYPDMVIGRKRPERRLLSQYQTGG
jgi:hypothetical protein